MMPDQEAERGDVHQQFRIFEAGEKALLGLAGRLDPEERVAAVATMLTLHVMQQGLSLAEEADMLKYVVATVGKLTPAARECVERAKRGAH